MTYPEQRDDRDPASDRAASAAGNAWRAVAQAAGPVLGIFLASRIAIQVVALLAVGLLPALPSDGGAYALLPASLADPISLWDRFDAGFYRDIAFNGYWTPESSAARYNWAFFPAYPWVVGHVANLFGGPSMFPSIGVALSMAFALVGLLAVYGIARQEEAPELAAVAFLVAYPSSFFFNAPYAEGMFLAASGLALFFAGRQNFLAAGAAAAVATVTRAPGILLMIPIVIFWWSTIEDHPDPLRERRTWLNLAGLVLPLLAFGGLLWIYQQTTGDAFAFVRDQGVAWNRGAVAPWNTLSGALQDPLGSINPYAWSIGPLDLVMALLAIAASAYLLATGRYALAAYGLVLVLVPLSTGLLVSMTRYMAVNIPMFIALALIASRVEWGGMAVLIVFAVLLGLQVTLFVLGVQSVV